MPDLTREEWLARLRRIKNNPSGRGEGQPRLADYPWLAVAEAAMTASYAAHGVTLAQRGPVPADVIVEAEGAFGYTAQRFWPAVSAMAAD